MVTYIIPDHERSASMYSGASTFSHVLVQARVRRGRRENKTRNNEVNIINCTQLTVQTVCSHEEWLITLITPPFIVVQIQASNSLILGATCFLGVRVPVYLRRDYAGFVKPLTEKAVLGPHKGAAQCWK